MFGRNVEYLGGRSLLCQLSLGDVDEFGATRQTEFSRQRDWDPGALSAKQ
jgi:hypothetical protein